MRYIAIPPGIPERTTALQPKEHLVLLGLQAMIAAVQPPLRDTLYIPYYTDSLPRINAFPLGVTKERFLKNKNYGAKFEGCSD